VEWIGCVRCEKFDRDFVARTFALVRSVLHPNGMKNATKRQFRLQFVGSGAFVAKDSDVTSWDKLLHSFGPFCTEFRKATKRSRMHPNGTKHTKMSVLGQMVG